MRNKIWLKYDNIIEEFSDIYEMSLRIDELREEGIRPDIIDKNKILQREIIKNLDNKKKIK